MSTLVNTPLGIAAPVTANAALAAGSHTPADATAGALTLTLPVAPAAGAHLSVEKLDATTNAVTVSGSLRGAASSITLVLQHETVELVADSVGSWWPIAGHKTKASLDAAYTDPAWSVPATALNRAPGAVQLSTFADFLVDPSGTGFHQFAMVDGATPGIYHATSTDGTVWVWDASPILTPGSETWENLTVGVPGVWVEGGTWYMTYRGTGNGGTALGIGLASASAAAGPWTRVQSGPSYIIPNVEAGPGRLIKVGATYYLHTSNTGGNRSIGVYSSTNRVTWTADPANFIWTGGRFCNCVWTAGGLYYALVPFYREGTTQADIELWRSTTPQFYPATRQNLGVIIPCGPTGNWSSNNLDTPTVLTTDITKSAYPAATGGLPWIYYSGQNGSGNWSEGLIKLPAVSILNTASTRIITGPNTPIGVGGNNSTRVGFGALPALSSGGFSNTAFGMSALGANTSGGQNAASGYAALLANTTGGGNVASGCLALSNNTTGNNDVAVGASALAANVSGSNLTGVGYNAGLLYTASNGVFVGSQAGSAPNGVAGNASVGGAGQTCIGTQSGQATNVDSNYIVTVGYLATAAGQNAIAIGTLASATATGAVAIGRDSAGTGATAATANEFVLGTALHTVRVKGTLRLDASIVTTVGAAGAAAATPTPVGYIPVSFNGTLLKVAAYNL